MTADDAAGFSKCKVYGEVVTLARQVGSYSSYYPLYNNLNRIYSWSYCQMSCPECGLRGDGFLSGCFAAIRKLNSPDNLGQLPVASEASPGVFRTPSDFEHHVSHPILG